MNSARRRYIPEGSRPCDHNSFAGDKGNDAARFRKVQGLDEEIVMDVRVQVIVAPVIDFNGVERDIAQNHIKAVVLKFVASYPMMEISASG